MAAVYRCEDKRQAVQCARAVLAEHFDASAEHADYLLQQASGGMVKRAALGVSTETGSQLPYPGIGTGTDYGL